MQDKKKIGSEGLSVTQAERLLARAVREELRRIHHDLTSLTTSVLALQGARSARHPLAVAASSLWVATKDVGVALSMVREMEARWERDTPTVVVRRPRR